MKEMNKKGNTGQPLSYSLSSLSSIPAFSRHLYYQIPKEKNEQLCKILNDLNVLKIKCREFFELPECPVSFLSESELTMIKTMRNFETIETTVKDFVKETVLDARSKNIKVEEAQLRQDMLKLGSIEALVYKISYLNHLQMLGVKLIGKNSSMKEAGSLQTIVFVCKWDAVKEYQENFERYINEPSKNCAFVDFDQFPIRDDRPTRPGVYFYKNGQFTNPNQVKVVPSIVNKVEPPTKQQNEDGFINILILGETGVGKSTFINGLSNYLLFNSFDEAAAADKLTYAIPSSFTFQDQNYRSVKITVGDTLDENVPKSGESVTKQSQSYKLKAGTRKIRIIDTPGMGDTAGISKDDENFQNILDFVGNFDKIHGICVLLKPNNSRINLTFRYCINELLTHLHKSAANNIIFCFTNSRTTFYKPGDSLPMLKSYIEQLKQAEGIDIHISKKTIYCFDNEPFKFICARQHGILFENDEMEHCKISWARSKEELDRMIDYIASLTPHQIKDSVTLNNARRVVVALCQPLADISSQIQLNLQELEVKKNEIMALDLNKEDIMKHLHTRQLVTYLKRLDEPTVVCKSLNCTKKNLDDIYNVIFDLKCCQNAWKKILKNHPKIINKSFRFHQASIMNKICNGCGCAYIYHDEIIEYKFKAWTNVADTKLVQALQETTKNQEKQEVFCRHVNDKIAYLTKEREQILKTAAQFATFLKVIFKAV